MQHSLIDIVWFQDATGSMYKPEKAAKTLTASATELKIDEMANEKKISILIVTQIF